MIETKTACLQALVAVSWSSQVSERELLSELVPFADCAVLRSRRSDKVAGPALFPFFSVTRSEVRHLLGVVLTAHKPWVAVTDPAKRE